MNSNDLKSVEDKAFILDLEEMLFEVHVDQGIDEETSINLAKEFIRNVAHKYKSEQVYIGSIDRSWIRKRDDQILAEFRGKNYRELAAKYNLSPRSIRSAIKRAQERQPKDKTQLNLL